TATLRLSGHHRSPALAVASVGDDLDSGVAAEALLDLIENVGAIAGDDEQVTDGRLCLVRHASCPVHGKLPRCGNRRFGASATSNAHVDSHGNSITFVWRVRDRRGPPGVEEPTARDRHMSGCRLALESRVPRGPLFYGWWIVAAGFGIEFLIGALMFHAYGAYAVLLREEFGWSKTILSAAFAMSRAESGILGPVQGWLTDRFGPRALIRVGMTIFGVGFLLFSRIDGPVVFFLTFFMMALGSSLGGYLPVSVAIVTWFRRRRALALSISGMGMSTGGLLAPLVALSLTRFGWRWTVVALLTVMQATGQFSGGWLGDRVSKRRICAGCMLGHATALMVLALASAYWMVLLFAVLHGLSWGMRGPLMAAIRADYFGSASFGTITGVSSMIVMFGMILGPLVAGVLADRTGSYVPGFSLLAALAAAGSVAFWRARRPGVSAVTFVSAAGRGT